jgi:CRP-like cAMP-binding protein/tRNA A-37 threonylcarbamoyl transferase component Bud32
MTDSAAKAQAIPAGKKAAFEPQSFGAYVLIDQISKGGMSDIFLAKSVGVGEFQKPLVIKKLLPHYSDKPNYIKRFVNEGKTMTRLNHSNIVHIIHMGVAEGEYYIAMEYIEGRNLAHILSKAKRSDELPPLGFSLHVMLELAKGLSYSHRRKGPNGEELMLVHQDVNSFNVMVTYEAEVKLIDFGIAKIFMEDDSIEDLPVAGKLLYFSPEQLQGRTVTRKVDIYGAGALFYELITGDRLVQHQETVAQTIKTILDLDVPERVRADDRIPQGLKPILTKAMARSPDDRYEWMDAMVEDIRHFMKAESIEYLHEDMADYMRSLFHREMLIDRRRMRKLYAAKAPEIVSDLDYADAGETTLEHDTDIDLLDKLSNMAESRAAKEESGVELDTKHAPRSITVPAGKPIYRPEDPASHVYAIKEGRVRIYQQSGQNQQTVSVVRAGDFFGEGALMEGSSCMAYAEALDDTELIVFHRDFFPKLVENSLARGLITNLVEKLRDARLLVAASLLDDPLSRFIYALIFCHRRVSTRSGSYVDLKEVTELFRLHDRKKVDKYILKLSTLKILDADDDKIHIKSMEKLENILNVLSCQGKLSLKL